jgi:hypothetical protein
MEEFLPVGDVIVVDNGSREPTQLHYLDELERRGVLVVRRPRVRPTAYRSDLHDAMNEIMDWACAKGYELLNFVQDDMQFLWRDPEHVARVDEVLRIHEDALQVSAVFDKKISKYRADYPAELYEKSRSRHIRPYGVADIGFVPLRRARAAGFRYLPTESASGAYWRERGYKLYGLHTPNLAYVPWPRGFSAIGKHTSRRGRRRRYYLRPLDAAKIRRLVERPLAEPAFLEDYSEPWGWRCLSPFWYTRFSWRRHGPQYLRHMLDFWQHREPLFPRFVGSK